MPDSSFTPLTALAGGLLIGLGASVYLLVNGRVAGISGILSRLLGPWGRGGAAGALFIAALMAVGAVSALFVPETIGASPATPMALAVAGLFVGFGTRWAGGCTSGHGLCGNSRGSLRSIIATATFIATGVATTTLVRMVGGGE